jgi:hypothetical protein
LKRKSCCAIDSGIYHADIRVDPSALGNDPVVTLKSRTPTEPLDLIVTTIGKPAFEVGDSLQLQIFYDDEVVEKDGEKCACPSFDCFSVNRLRCGCGATMLPAN